MSTYALNPVDSRKSFYNKCHCIEELDVVKLQSYSTIVAEFNRSTGKLTINGYYSPTTARHLNSFLSHIGRPLMSKAEIEAFVNE